MLRTPAAVLAFLAFVLPAFAQSDPDWVKKPYALQVNILAEPHPLLTSEFLEKLQREVRDSLQRDLGKIAVVEVIAEAAREPKKLNPLAAEVAKQGWDALDKPTYPITGKKAHLIKLRYDDGEYIVEGRQVDGDSGLVSPLRRTRTGDRLWVSRAAALMIGQDFGLTAAITDVNDQTVLFQLRAGGLGKAETIGVNTGEVFALSRVLRGPNGDVGRREEFALLFVTGIDAATGRGTGRLYTRYLETLQRARNDRVTVGFRAIKLGTLRTPLQVRVVNAKDNAPVPGCEVVLYPGGFPNARRPNEISRQPVKLGVTDSTGRIASASPIDHVAFGRFQVGALGVDIPIGLFDDQPVTIRLNNVEQADRLAEFLNDQKMWERQCDDLVNYVQGEYEKIGGLPSEQRQKELLPRLEALSAKMKEDMADLKAKFNKLKESSAEAGDSAKNWLNSDLARLKSLDQALAAMEQMIKDEKDPSPEQKEFNAGMVAEKNYQYDEALKHYAKAYQLNKNKATFKLKYEKFSKAWRATTAEHKAAREFFVKTWKDLTWREMRDKFEECEKKMEVLRAQNDYLTATLLVKTNLEVMGKLKAMLDQPKANADEGDSDRAADIEDLLLKLRDMNNDLLDFIRQNSGG